MGMGISRTCKTLLHQRGEFCPESWEELYAMLQV